MLLIYRLVIEHKTEMLLHLRKIHEMLAYDRKGLGISNRDWKFVGKICNDSRLYEAAHRKKDDAGNELRHATTEELDSVLMHVQIWITKYADSLSDPQ